MPVVHSRQPTSQAILSHVCPVVPVCMPARRDKPCEDGIMSHGGDLFALGSEAAPVNLGFESVLRGYDKRQVAAYVEQAEAEIAALVHERDEALRHAQVLAAESEALRAEVTEFRKRSPIT